VPIGREYRITGDGVRPSRAFPIEAAPGQHVTISVSAASRGAFGAGVALSSLGAVAVGIGLVILVVGAVGTTSCDINGFCTNNPPNSSVETAGAVVALAGAGVMVGGIVLMVSNARTKTFQSVGALVSPTARPETAWLRAPIWHDVARDSSPLPKATTFPLLSRSF
jgi:hypothetical protein